MQIEVVHHPLVKHILTRLRDATTEPAQFRALARQLTLLLAIEATRDLPLREQAVQTPLEPTQGHSLAQPIVAVPILRAGLGMLEAITELFTEVRVGYIGLERDEATAVARAYYCKLPPIGESRVLLLDPMLATGGSAAQAIEVLLKAGAQRHRAYLCGRRARRRAPLERAVPAGSNRRRLFRSRAKRPKIHSARLRRFRRSALRHRGAVNKIGASVPARPENAVGPPCPGCFVEVAYGTLHKGRPPNDACIIPYRRRGCQPPW
jgi:uracil phosphoribosyltransferase